MSRTSESTSFGYRQRASVAQGAAVISIAQSHGGGRAGASGYTRTVSWKQRISVVLLVVLAAVPVSGALCAMVCGSSAETPSAHHGARTAQQCDEPARSSTAAGVQIGGVSEHDCKAHDAGLPQLATAAAERTGLHVAAALSTASALHTIFKLGSASVPGFDNTRPPGWAPPTIPLVLRV
jgi:hypothetical protein